MKRPVLLLVFFLFLCALSCERLNPDLHRYIGVKNESDKNMVFGYILIDTTDDSAPRNREFYIADLNYDRFLIIDPEEVVKPRGYSSEAIMIYQYDFGHHNYWEWALEEEKDLYIFAIDATNKKSEGEEYYKNINNLQHVYNIPLAVIKDLDWAISYPAPPEYEVATASKTPQL